MTGDQRGDSLWIAKAGAELCAMCFDALEGLAPPNPAPPQTQGGA